MVADAAMRGGGLARRHESTSEPTTAPAQYEPGSAGVRRSDNSTASLVDAALALAKLDLRVFPVHGIAAAGRCTCGNAACPNAGKHPRLSAWQRKATTDPQQIRRWWSREPRANIGIATGELSGLLVLDVDVGDGKPGLASLGELEARHGARPRTWEVQTGGGGLHVYLRHPGGDRRIGNRAGILPGLDLRGDGGYVVAPPSLHASGRRYTWLEAGDAPEVPAPAGWLLAVLDAVDEKPGDRRRHNGAARRGGGATTGGPSTPYGRAAMEDECRALAEAPKGTRNHALNRSAFSLAQLVAGEELDAAGARAALLTAAAACGLVDDDRREAVERTLTSGWKAGLAEPRTAPPGRRGRRRSGTGEAADLPTIIVTGRELPKLSDAAAACLDRANDPPRLFRSGNRLVRVRLGEDGTATHEPVTAAILRFHLARAAHWKRQDGEAVCGAFPPREVVQDVAAHPDLHLPMLRGLARCPVLRPDGTLASTTGYDASTRLWVDLSGCPDLVPPPERPTQPDVAAALALLVDDLLFDFPFANDASRAHALAALVLPVVRPAVDGPTPLHGIEAPVPHPRRRTRARRPPAPPAPRRLAPRAPGGVPAAAGASGRPWPRAG